MARPTSRWSGTTLEDRAAARRAALVQVGVDLLGTESAAGVTVRAACRAAKLSERYFYESFDGRDDLLRAVHAQVAGEARDAIAAAVAARRAGAAPEGAAGLAHASVAAHRAGPAPEGAAGLAHASVAAHRAGPAPEDDAALAHAAVAAFTAFLEADPRRGRVLLSESFSDTVLARHDMELVPAFAALLVAQIRALPDPPDATDAELTAVALLGALRNLYLAWLAGDPPISSQRLNAHAAELIIAAARISSRRAT